MRVKTHMGLERFEVRFFFGEKFTKIDLALKVVIKNLSKVVWGLSVKFSRIWMKNFVVVKIHMGTPLEWKILLRSKNFQLHFRSKPNKSPKKLSLKIGYKIPWTYVRLILKFFHPHQKSYGFKRLFVNGVFVRRLETVTSNRLRFQQQVASEIAQKLPKESLWCF